MRTAPSGVTRSVFVSIANLDVANGAAPRSSCGATDQLLESRDVDIDAQQRADVIIDDVDGDVEVVEVRLVARDRGATRRRPDLLAADDRAWAIVPPDRDREILLVGDGDPFLETALSYLPNTALFGVKPDRYPQDARRTDGTDWDLIIFEDFVPAELPAAPTLLVAPPEDEPARRRSRDRSRNPGIGSLVVGRADPALRRPDDDPHLRGRRARRCRTGPDRSSPARRALPCSTPASGPTSRRAVLAFEPRNSDLPLQVAFPILIANLTGELMGGSAAPTDTVKPGDPVSLPLAGGATGLRVERPDGSVVELAPGTTGAAAVTFTQTDLLGVYTATPVFPEGATPVRRPRRPDRRRLARPASPSGQPGGRRPWPAATRRRRSCSRSTCSTSASRRSRRATGIDLEKLGPPGRARPGRRAPRRSPTRRPRTGRRPATSCGCRSCSSSSSGCASSGRSTTATSWCAAGARSGRVCAGPRDGSA